MEQRDQAAIEELFRKLGEVEHQSGPRDPEAEAYISAQTNAQPGAAYYMAQTILVQEHAMLAAQQRIEDLEAEVSRAPAGGGGFLGGLFGGGSSRQQRPDYRTSRSGATAQPWGASQGMGRGMSRGGMGGGGFLAGAAQTAMGVAGGVMLGSMLSGWMSPDAADAGGLADAGDEAGTFGDARAETEVADAGGDFGGDMDFGDF